MLAAHYSFYCMTVNCDIQFKVNPFTSLLDYIDINIHIDIASIIHRVFDLASSFLYCGGCCNLVRLLKTFANAWDIGIHPSIHPLTRLSSPIHTRKKQRILICHETQRIIQCKSNGVIHHRSIFFLTIFTISPWRPGKCQQPPFFHQINLKGSRPG